MEPTQDIAAYALALFITAFIPGPGITALVARSAAQGPVAGAAMTAGLLLGDFVYLSLAVFGLSIIAEHFNLVFSVIRGFSVIYLLVLAWQFWHAKPSEMTVEPITRRTLIAAAVSGFGITMSNPKVIAFYLALMPLVIDLNQITFGIWAGVLLPVTFSVLIFVATVYVAGAQALRQWLTTTNAQRWLNRGAAVAMTGAAVSMLIKAN